MKVEQTAPQQKSTSQFRADGKNDTSWFSRIDSNAVLDVVSEVFGTTGISRDEFATEWGDKDKPFSMLSLKRQNDARIVRGNYDFYDGNGMVPSLVLVARDGDDLHMDMDAENTNIKFYELLRKHNLVA